MMKQSLLFSYPERGKARNLRAKQCAFFTHQKAQHPGKLSFTIFKQQPAIIALEKIL